ncbi:hypothetical protein ACIQH5_21580 [Paenarthrobacter sp. NPDC091711]|uniref:hypothetical protein n=1 Tax=Paenarthrobacter sp. NPDC091711 TaxID=3364385 RepID=UPI003829B1DB
MDAWPKNIGARGRHVAADDSHGVRTGGTNKRQLCNQFKGIAFRNSVSDAQQSRWDRLYN